MYLRVIPRDLFNEANLLKCLGKLYLCLETLNPEGVTLEHDGEAFEIDQSEDSGGLFVRNVTLIVRGEEVHLWRPLNSRHAWPLYLTLDLDDEEYSVFDDDGNLSIEMLKFLTTAVEDRDQHTEQMGNRIESDARGVLERHNVKAFFEHGQWWVEDTETGAQWAVNDAETQTGGKYFDYEQVTQGDED